MTRRRVLMVAAALATAFVAFEVWRTVTAPEPPAIAYTGVDPEVIAAMETARLAVKDHPRSGEHWGRYGMVLGAHNYTEPAAACFAMAARYDESNPRWPHLEALQYLNSGKLQQAVPLLRRALALAPTRDERGLSLFYIATAHISLGELDAAEAAIRELGAVEPESVRHRFLRGLLAVARGNGDEARTLLESVAQEPAVRKRVCELLAQSGDPGQRSARREQCGQLPPDTLWHNPHMEELMRHQVPTRNRSAAYQQLVQQGRTEEAREFLERLVAESPDAETTYLLGVDRLQRKEYRPAADAFESSLRFDSKNARAHLNLASARFELGEDRAAADAAARAVSLQANLTAAHTIRGRALKRLKLTEESIQAFRDAVTGQPESADLHRELGEELAESGRVAEGIGHLEDAVKLSPPDDPRARAALDKWKGKK